MLVALSGGADSVALTLLLRDLSEYGEFTLAGLAHFNHQLRPTASRDEQFCRDLASRLGMAILVDGADVLTYAARQGRSIEDAARRLRYEFLERAAVTLRADQVAVGHTRDDQAETFLLKLIRGAGMGGLAGIFPRRGMVIRPLLDIARGDLRAFLVARGERWQEDETNLDLANPRNRIRHLVLPELDNALAGRSAGPIARAAELLREDGAWIDEVAERRYRALAVEVASNVHFDQLALEGEPAPLRRRLVLMALRKVAGGREVTLEHVRAALDVAEGGGGADLPGSRVERRSGKLVLFHQGETPK